MLIIRNLLTGGNASAIATYISAVLSTLEILSKEEVLLGYVSNVSTFKMAPCHISSSWLKWTKMEVQVLEIKNPFAVR